MKPCRAVVQDSLLLGKKKEGRPSEDGEGDRDKDRAQTQAKFVAVKLTPRKDGEDRTRVSFVREVEVLKVGGVLRFSSSCRSGAEHISAAHLTPVYHAHTRVVYDADASCIGSSIPPRRRPLGIDERRRVTCSVD